MMLSCRERYIDAAQNHRGPMLSVISLGFGAVDIFFVMTGFLIALPFLRTPMENFSFRGYLWKRFVVRLYPMLVVALIIHCTVFWDGTPLEVFGTSTIPDMVRQATPNATHSSSNCALSPFNLLFVNNFLPFGGCLIHTWSLSVQGQFYFFFPLLLMMVGNRKGLIAVSVAAILLSIGSRLATYFIFQPILSQAPPAFAFTPDLMDRFFVFFQLFYAFTLNRFNTIFFGVLLAVLQKYVEGHAAKPPSWMALLRNPVINVVVAAFAWYLSSRNAAYQIGSWFYSVCLFIGSPALAIGICFFIFISINSLGPVGVLLNRFFSLRIWLLPSKLSYITYLIHPIVIVKSYHTIFRPVNHDAASTYQYMAFHVVVVYVTSFVLFHLIEEPAAKFLSAMNAKKKAV